MIHEKKIPPKQSPLRHDNELACRYGAIGIPALAAAVRYQGTYQEAQRQPPASKETAEPAEKTETEVRIRNRAA